MNPLKKGSTMLATYRRIKQRRSEAEDTEEGFTLIELLIVIVVLGILAAVVVFSLGGVTGKSAVAACQADGNTVETAIAAFNANNPGLTVTQSLLTGSTDGGPYIQSWPSNAPHYAYSIDSSGKLEIAVPSSGTPGLYTGPGSCSTVQ